MECAALLVLCRLSKDTLLMVFPSQHVSAGHKPQHHPLVLPCHHGSHGEQEEFAEKPLASPGAAPVWLSHMALNL